MNQAPGIRHEKPIRRIPLFQFLGLSIVFVTGAVGCGPSGPTTHEVRGRVTFDGVALPDAQIQFWPESQWYDPPFTRSTKDGRYRAHVRPGEHTIRIRAQKTVAAPPGTRGPRGLLSTVSVDVIPERYNVASELQLTVSGPTEKNLDLLSR